MEKILVIGGSNSINSINQWFAKELAKQENVDYIDTRELNIPYYNRDIEETSGIAQEVINLYNKLHDYNKLIIISPEYNGYASSFFKSITDWLSRYERFYLENIDLVIVSVTPGKAAGASVRESLTKMLSFTKANILGDYGIGEFDQTKDHSDDIKNILKMFK
ncbi:chromate reductase [Bacilli bacterium PM5-3]|nr:chromate reductase [Bacilli bacterium PM5-3]MDH6603466.1 chromate reductase [Bacilli bacterium PM5-9]